MPTRAQHARAPSSPRAPARAARRAACPVPHEVRSVHARRSTYFVLDLVLGTGRSTTAVPRTGTVLDFVLDLVLYQLRYLKVDLSYLLLVRITY